MDTSSKLFWAFLWVIGIPLPVLIILYFITGGACSPHGG
jgi:hypothetical protein